MLNQGYKVYPLQPTPYTIINGISLAASIVTKNTATTYGNSIWININGRNAIKKAMFLLLLREDTCYLLIRTGFSIIKVLIQKILAKASLSIYTMLILRFGTNAKEIICIM